MKTLSYFYEAFLLRKNYVKGFFKEMKKVFSMFFIALFAFVLISCGAKEIKLSLNDADKSITLVEGEEKTIVPTLVGEATLVWSSSDDAIASVSNGTITAISSGSVVITVSVKDHDDIKAEMVNNVAEENWKVLKANRSKVEKFREG